MSVKVTVKEDGKVELLLDNGDLIKMQEVLEKWKFKDEQSFWRFSVSILLKTEDNSLWIKENGKAIAIAPADHSIKH